MFLPPLDYSNTPSSARLFESSSPRCDDINLPLHSITRIPYPTLDYSNTPSSAELIESFYLGFDYLNTLPSARLFGYFSLRLIIRMFFLSRDYFDIQQITLVHHQRFLFNSYNPPAYTHTPLVFYFSVKLLP